MAKPEDQITALLGLSGRCWLGFAVRVAGGWLVEDMRQPDPTGILVTPTQKSAEAYLRDMGTLRILRCTTPAPVRKAKRPRKRRP